MNEKRYPEQKVMHKIGRSNFDIVAGAGLCFIGGLILMALAAMLLPVLPSSNSAEAGYALGRATFFGAFGVGALIAGFRKFRTVPLTDAVALLKNKDVAKRRWAAKGLSKVGWVPTDETQQLDFLVASEKWDDLTALGSKGVVKMCGSLSAEGVPLPSLLQALGKSKDVSAVKPLMDLLGHKKTSRWRGDITKALREITGKDFGKKREDWLTWWHSERGNDATTK